MPIPQPALNLSFAAMRRLNSAWGGLTALRKMIVVSIAVMAVGAASINLFTLFAMNVLSFALLLLLIWGLARFFGLLGLSKWSENIRVALALAVVVGFFLFCGFMAMPEPRVFRHAELNAEMQEVRIERNRVRMGMTINDVLPLVHGMNIFASAEGAWLSVLPDTIPPDSNPESGRDGQRGTNKRFYYSPDPIEAWQHNDGTYAFSCHCGSAQISPNSRVAESQAAALFIQRTQPGQDLQNLTESQAAALMKQKMSDGFDWSWQYKTFKRSREYVFTVTFGRDGRVNHISDVYYTDLQYHRP